MLAYLLMIILVEAQNLIIQICINQCVFCVRCRLHLRMGNQI